MYTKASVRRNPNTRQGVRAGGAQGKHGQVAARVQGQVRAGG